MARCTLNIISDNKYSARTIELIGEELGFDAVISDKADGNINIIDSSAHMKDSFDENKCIYLSESGEAIPKGIKYLLSKPFAWDELRKAVKNLYSEQYGEADEKIMIDGNTLIYSGKKLILSETEFSLFNYLYTRENTPISREELLLNVWNGKKSGTNITDVYINYVKHKILDAFGLDVIHSVRGVGYIYRTNK